MTDRTLEHVSDGFAKRMLYGGAISCELPSHWRDVSLVRPVPDHQECWQDLSSDTAESPGGSLWVMETLAFESTVTAERIAEYLFADLAELNMSSDDANQQSMSFVADPPVSTNDRHWTFPVGMPLDAALCCGSGTQRVRVGRHHESPFVPDADDDTNLALAAQRENREPLQNVHVHLAALRLPPQETELLITFTIPSSSVPGDDTSAVHSKQLFQRIVASIQILDWSLFG